MTTPMLALLDASVLALLSAVHVFWAASGRAIGRSAIPERDGKPLFQPSRAATLAVAVALVTAAAIVLAQAFLSLGGVIGLLVRVSSWLVGVAFLLRAIGDFRYVGLFKRVRGTEFARLDTLLYSPLCLVLGAATLAVASRWLG